MKRIRLLILLSVLAVALPVGFLSGVAKATGSSRTSVSISQTADYNFAGTQLDVNLLVRCSGGMGLAEVTVNQLDVGLNVRCTGSTGTATVHVMQTPPESTHPVSGFGIQDVVCDGQTHSVGVTLIGSVYDPGRAYAIADVTAPSGPGHAEKWITIFVN
jgi:hypothetical protein